MGVLRGDPPEIFLASSATVLGRLLALKIVASSEPDIFQRVGTLDEVREALLNERWADAVLLWMDATGQTVDGYPDEEVWTDSRLDADLMSLELRMTRVFGES